MPLSFPLILRWMGALVLAIVLLSAAGSGAKAMKSDLWERWTAHDANAVSRLNHVAWDYLLDTYLRRSGNANLFAYGAVTPEDKALLDEYVASLAGVPISRYARDEQLAYWINFYNALTVKVVLDNYPVKSIREIDSFLRLGGPWDEKRVAVEGQALSLDDVEHRIIRPIWRDPRVHYALNCAAKGCPNLPAVAFTARNTDALLDAGARAYINDSRGARLNGRDLYVSSLYKWYREDFGGNEAGVLAHLMQYAAPALRARLAEVKRIAGDGYDWDLNDALR